MGDQDRLHFPFRGICHRHTLILRFFSDEDNKPKEPRDTRALASQGQQTKQVSANVPSFPTV